MGSREHQLCEACGAPVVPEHGHEKCPNCGWLTHCCSGEQAQPDQFVVGVDPGVDLGSAAIEVKVNPDGSIDATTGGGVIWHPKFTNEDLIRARTIEPDFKSCYQLDPGRYRDEEAARDREAEMLERCRVPDRLLRSDTGRGVLLPPEQRREVAFPVANYADFTTPKFTRDEVRQIMTTIEYIKTALPDCAKVIDRNGLERREDGIWATVVEAETCVLMEDAFKSVEKWNDAARFVWIHEKERAVLTYCEGDLTLEIYSTEDDFIKALGRCNDFYTEMTE
jgi:hypothetical protein